MRTRVKKSMKVVNQNNGPQGFVFFAAWIGAVVYFVGKVDGFWPVIVAFLKACVWPAYLVYHTLLFLHV